MPEICQFRCKCGEVWRLRLENFPHECVNCGRTYEDPKDMKKISKGEFIKEAKERNEVVRTYGPGYFLYVIFQELKMEIKPGCRCKAMMRQMERWGVEGCRKEKNFEIIVTQLEEDSKLYNWREKAIAKWQAVRTGLAWKIDDWNNPFPSCVNEAIRRAEDYLKEQSPTAGCPT